MVRQAFIWSFSGQIASFAIQFGASIVMARLLSPREMGIYAIAGSIIGIVQLFTSFSVATYVVREETLQPHTVDTAFTMNMVLSCTLATLIVLLSFLVTPMLHEPKVGQVLRLLALLPLINMLGFRPSAMLQRTMQLRGVSLLGVLNGVLTSAVTIAAALLGQSSLSYAYGALVGAAFSSAGTLWIGREHNSLHMSLRDWRPIAAFGLRLMSIGGLSIAADRACSIILARLLGLAALGLYNRANNLNNLLFTNVYGSATRVVFAKLSAARRDGDRVREVFVRGFRLITAVMGPLLLGLAVLGGPVIYSLYGDKWRGAEIPFSLLMIGQFITLAFAMNWELFVVRDDLKTQTRLELVRSATNVASQIVTCFISLVAVAASGIFDAMVSVLIYQRHMVRLIDCPERQLWRMYEEVVLLSAVAALPSLVLMIAAHWDPHVPLPAILACVAGGGGLWVLLLRRLNHPLVEEAAMLFAKLNGWRQMRRQSALRTAR